MGIQIKQIDNLEETINELSGYIDTEVGGSSDTVHEIASGVFSFKGSKTFSGNCQFSGVQGLMAANSIYTNSNVFANSVKIGYPISSPRGSTAGPQGSLQVSGGQINLEDQVNILNDSSLIVENGSVLAGTGDFENITVSYMELSGALTGFLKIYDLPDHTQTGNIPGDPSGIVFRSGNNLMVV